ncbi:hypothetical protein [Parasphingorhabdus litoris]|nr:hypothetical protein [Parasphingorhabdus litoris]
MKLPKIGTPYVAASKTWRLMRWLIPIGVFGVALLPDLYSEFVRPKATGPQFGFHTPRSVDETAESIFFRIFIPTVLLYRLAISIGERFWKKNPIRGAIAVVTVVALVPPFVNGLLVQRTINNMEFVDHIPNLTNKSVLLESAYCVEDCFRLLYSSKVKQVILKNPEHTDDIGPTNKVETYRLGVAPDCNFDWYKNPSDIKSADIIEAWPATAAAMGQIVAGNCIVNGQSESSKADFYFRPRWQMFKYHAQYPDKNYPELIAKHGINHAEFASLYKIQGGKNIELLRVNGRHKMDITRYPTTLTFFRRLFLTHDSYYGKSDRIQNKLVKLGLDYAAADFIDIERSTAIVLDLIQHTERPLSNAEKYFLRHYLLRLKEDGLSSAEEDQLQIIKSDGRIYEP